MALNRIPYSELVGILIDHKHQLAEDTIVTPFAEADDAKLARAAGMFLKHLVHYRDFRSQKSDPMVRMLEVVGYGIKRMKIAEVEDLITELDDLNLKMTNFATYLLSKIEDKLQWCVSAVELDEGAETVNVRLGQDYRITRYYELSREVRVLSSLPIIKLPTVVNEVGDLDDVEHTFRDLVNSIFNQVDRDDVREELKKRLLTHISSK